MLGRIVGLLQCKMSELIDIAAPLRCLYYQIYIRAVTYKVVTHFPEERYRAIISTRDSITEISVTQRRSLESHMQNCLIILLKHFFSFLLKFGVRYLNIHI